MLLIFREEIETKKTKILFRTSFLDYFPRTESYSSKSTNDEKEEEGPLFQYMHEERRSYYFDGIYVDNVKKNTQYCDIAIKR